MIAVSPESIRVSAQLIAKIGTAELTRPVSASRHAARRSSATVSWTPKRTSTIGTSVKAPSVIRIPTRSSGSSSRSPILMNMNEAPQSAASPSSIRRWARRTPSVTPYDRRVFHEAVRAIAIDWSGARERERFALQAAAAPPLRLLGGFTRAEAAEFKVESHNHPSAVEPFQGAATGVGGILRDIVAMGARPIALLDGLRFGVDGWAFRR